MKERRGSDCNWSTSRIAWQVSLLVLSTKEDPCFFWCQWKAVCVHAQSCPTLCNPMDCSLPGSSVHGILQARILEWVVISFSRGSSQPRDWTYISCTSRQILYHWATRSHLSLLTFCFWSCRVRKIRFALSLLPKLWGYTYTLTHRHTYIYRKWPVHL